ncbi:MAG: hypothetical protein GX750_08710 [Clostridia bacterium]|nr:hypothetical protein [Clostridia bacterium]
MDLVNKGRKLLIVLIASFLIISFSTMILSSWLAYAMGELEVAIYGLLQNAIRFALECFLFWLIFKGYRWARIVMAILFGIGGIVSLIMALAGDLFMIISTILCIAVVFILSSKPVVAFQRYKREGVNIAGEHSAGS